MLVTEEEACKLQCPHTTYCVNEVHVTNYQSPAITAQAACCASSCMAWRWGGVKDVTDEPSHEYPQGKVTSQRAGFCGLSGRPN